MKGSLLLLVLSLLLTGCSAFGAKTTPTMLPQASQRITVEAPPADATVSSPVLVRGTLASAPAGAAINYRVFDSRNMLVGSGVLPVQTEAPTRFSGQVTFATTQAGPGRIELFEFTPSDNVIRGGVIVPVTLTAAGLTGASTASALATKLPGATTALPGMATALPGMATALPGTVIAQPTAMPQTGQQIVIETPAPGTQVGSPVVLTGRTLRIPAQNMLRYRVVDASQRQLGGGVIPVASAADGVLRFNGSLLFSEPVGGGTIRIDLADQADGATTAAAVASITLIVAGGSSAAGPTATGAQQISISSPAPNTAVTSPVVITGRTSKMPFQSNLSYTIRDSSGRTLASGLIGVDGSPPAFNVALPFDAPAPGTAIMLELLDQDAENGTTAARTSLPLFYNTVPSQSTATALPVTAAPSNTAQASGQLITIETPASNTIVGNPVTVTGRVAVTPSNGTLFYRIFDAKNTLLGESSFAVGRNGDALAFSAALSYTQPQQAGSIMIEITDRDANGATRARSMLLVQVAAAYPAP